MAKAGVPTTKRLDVARLKLAGAILGALALGMVVMALLQKHQAATAPAEAPLPPIYEVSGDMDALQRLQLKTSWAGEDRTPPQAKPPPPVPPTLPPQPPLFPPAVAQAAPVPVSAPQVASPFVPPSVVPATTTPTPATQPAAATAARPAQAATPAAPPPVHQEEGDWLFAEIKSLKRTAAHSQGSPGGDAAGGTPGGRGRTSALFPVAQWERPADPTKVLYASQIIHVITEQAISSEESATVRLRVTETVYDRFGQLHVLIPQDSMILATAEGGNVQRGQSRIALKISKVELPDGTDLVLAGKGGSADGAVGIPGRVDNKYGTVIAATLLSTVFSIGPRVVAGSPSGFQPNLGQEFAGNAATQMSQNGQEIVKRALDVKPVISVEALTPATVSLDHNISLQTPPVIVTK